MANTKPRAHTRPIMQQLSILTLSNLYGHRVCTEMHTHIFQQRQKNRPQHSHSYIGTAHIHHYRTRYSRQNNQYIRNNRYRKNPYRKDKQGGGAENHFSRQYAEVWNSIDDQLKNIENTKQFAKELKKWLLSQQANRRWAMRGATQLLAWEPPESLCREPASGKTKRAQTHTHTDTQHTQTDRHTHAQTHTRTDRQTHR